VSATLQFVASNVVSVYAVEIKAFIASLWRSFRRARTEDLKVLTARQLGPDKHSLPDPVSRESFKTALALGAQSLFLPLLTPYPWTRWMFQAFFYYVMLRWLCVMAILICYRAKLLPRVLAQA
jgi:hypothetical protein